MDSRVLFFFLLVLLPFSAAADLSSDRSALLAFRSAVGRSVLTSWNASAASPCEWEGVDCDAARHRVVGLHFPGAGLIGQIPAGTLGGLSALRTVSLRFNALSGPLPSDLANCTDLRNLYLHGNRFSGEFPPPVLALTNLIRLNLAGNELSGEIPAAVGKLPRVRTLYLEKNNFSGSIPDLKLPNLELFNVSFNNLNGSIPPSLRKFRPTAFMGLTVCGRPLPACPGEISPSPAPSPSPAASGPAPSGSAAGGGESKKSSSSSKLSGGAIAGIVVGSVAGVLLLLVLLYFLCRKKGASQESKATAAVAMRESPARAPAPAPAVTAPSLPKAAEAVADAKKLVFFKDGGRGEFDLEDLLRASAEVLGKGTFGTTYKAVLDSGLAVAVKRLKDVVNLNEREFKEKIEVIGAMDHPNLVPLKAYYFSKDEKLLVYDFLHNGSLSALLHGGSGQIPLNWDTRSAIALGAARGLAYIHSTDPSSSHGNVKASNILLGDSQDARISDHGLANLVGPAASSALARAAGYHAPEVTDPRRISQKADVYSFGILLLELLTGKAPTEAALNGEGFDLPRWVQSVAREEWTSEVFDAELVKDSYAEEEMVKLLQLGIDCAAQHPDSRPSMPEVVSRIEDIRRQGV